MQSLEEKKFRKKKKVEKGTAHLAHKQGSAHTLT